MRKQIIAICLASLFLLFIGSAIAGRNIPRSITFRGNPEGGGLENIYPSTYTGRVRFQHVKHAQEYTEGCGSCHHDSDMEPIEDYDPDETYSCISCHEGEGFLRGPISENSYSEEDLNGYRANAIHRACIDCHKDHNNRKHSLSAPEACRFCHAIRPRDYALE